MATFLSSDDPEVVAAFRVIRHLMPDALAWRLAELSTIRKLIASLSETPASARAFVDLVYSDLFPFTTRALAEWQSQFALVPPATEADQRKQLDATWKARGGQSPRYIQDVLQAAGFRIFVHEWWEPGSMPRVARDPRDYTNVPLIGSVQCGEPAALCGEPSAQCNRFLANETDYIVNENLTRVAPPPVPDDPSRWPFFIYLGGETFPDRAPVPPSRRAELERLILKLRPQQQWIVMLVDYVDWEELEYTLPFTLG